MVTRTLALGVLLAAFLGTALAGASIQSDRERFRDESRLGHAGPTAFSR